MQNSAEINSVSISSQSGANVKQDVTEKPDEETDDLLEAIGKNWLARFRRNLPKWYQNQGRELPWRLEEAGTSQAAYLVWISEIMLQQTTVAAVIPYYERFLNQFPTVEALARADEADVLKLWEGLGYYSRARNLHKAARKVANECAGEFPRSAAELIKLPGIGRYTAGAIASFAFDERAPIVEANTLRLYSRLLGFEGDPRSTAGQSLLWNFAEKIVPRKEPGNFNQALMDLGSQICQVTEPLCERCPVTSCCAAFAAGTQQEIPRPKTKIAITPVTEATIAIESSGQFLIRQRLPGERWENMWDFPRMEIPESIANSWQAAQDPSLSSVLTEFLHTSFQEITGIQIGHLEFMMDLRHAVTRYRIHLHCFRGEPVGVPPVEEPSELATNLRWVTLDELADYALPVTGRKFVKKLRSRC